MIKSIFLLICLLALLLPMIVFSQETNDSIDVQEDATAKFTLKQLIIPASLITVGAWGSGSDWVKDIKEEVASHRSHKLAIDNYIQYLPAVSFYGLDLVGAKPKHNYADRTLILATSCLSMGILVGGVKYAVGHPRPDKPNQLNSFPSGHTATAFMGAELVRREYWDDSPWYGIAAYSVATGVGVLRVYNERHWASDVLAGAGFGILSAEIGYWLLPFNKRLFHCNQTTRSQLAITPYYTGQQGGLSLSYQF
jgi:membrane-associated phospholipid phosphatase